MDHFLKTQEEHGKKKAEEENVKGRDEDRYLTRSERNEPTRPVNPVSTIPGEHEPDRTAKQDLSIVLREVAIDDCKRPVKPQTTKHADWWFTTDEAWRQFNEEEKWKRSHVGLIMETYLGEDRYRTCDDCRRVGHVCRQYVEKAKRSLLKASVRELPKSCAWCHERGQSCTPEETAPPELQTLASSNPNLAPTAVAKNSRVLYHIPNPVNAKGHPGFYRRRPTTPNETDFWHTDQEKWDRLKEPRLAFRSHAGWIMETTWGVDADEPCEECKLADRECRVFSEAGMKLLPKHTQHLTRCASCHMLEKPCKGKSNLLRGKPTLGDADDVANDTDPVAWLYNTALGNDRAESWKGLVKSRTEVLVALGLNGYAVVNSLPGRVKHSYLPKGPRVGKSPDDSMIWIAYCMWDEPAKAQWRQSDGRVRMTLSSADTDWHWGDGATRVLPVRLFSSQKSFAKAATTSASTSLIVENGKLSLASPQARNPVKIGSTRDLHTKLVDLLLSGDGAVDWASEYDRVFPY